MARIIRLTERDLTRIVRRVISEEVEMSQAKKMAMTAKLKANGCWDTKKYPNTARAIKGLAYANVSVGLFAAAAALASTGVAIPAALALMLGADVALSAALVEGIAVLINGNQTKNEIKKLSSCLWDKVDYFDIF